MVPQETKRDANISRHFGTKGRLPLRPLPLSSYGGKLRSSHCRILEWLLAQILAIPGVAGRVFEALVEGASWCIRVALVSWVVTAIAAFIGSFAWHFILAYIKAYQRAEWKHFVRQVLNDTEAVE